MPENAIHTVRKTALMLAMVLVTACTSSRYEIQTKPAGEKPPDRSYAVASWYGADFQGRPTASGEPFNMYANTCAHKEYVFGTRLRVTNVSNNRGVECVVNDRGPFVEGRDLDLSYAAAKEIGLVGPGTGRVLLEYAGRDSSYIRQVKVQSSDKKGPFAIQVGSFSENVNAIRLKKALALKYSNVYIQEAEVKGGTYYRVRLGSFTSLSNAMTVAETLGQEGYPTIVLKADLEI